MGVFRSDSFVEDIDDFELVHIEDEEFLPGTLFVANWALLPERELQASVKRWEKTIPKYSYQILVAYKATLSQRFESKEFRQVVFLTSINNDNQEKETTSFNRNQFKELLSMGVLTQATATETYTKAILRGLDARKPI